MKIGVNTLFLIPGEVGGTETVVRQVLGKLPALLADGDELVVFLNGENRKILLRDLHQAPRTRLVDTRLRATSRVRRCLFENLTLPRLLRAAAVDVLWNPGNNATLRPGCPQVTTIHDMQYTRFPEDFTKATLRVMQTLVPWSARHSNLVLTISEFSRREIAERAPAPFDKIRVALPAVEPAFSEPLPGAFLAERVMALTRYPDPYLLAVSNTYPHKSMETVVQAFARIQNRIPHRLVLVGRPRLGEPALEAALEALPDSARVTRLHYVEKQDLIALYQRAEAFLFPSRYEGFGLPVLEALSCGLPVICCREGSVPEIAGEAALYAKTGDPADFAAQILSVIASSPEAAALRTRLSEAGRARARQFSWQRCAAQTLAALREAVEAD